MEHCNHISFTGVTMRNAPFWTLHPAGCDDVLISQIRILNDHAVEGYRIITGWAKLRKIYFYMEFSSPILTSTLRDGRACS